MAPPLNTLDSLARVEVLEVEAALLGGDGGVVVELVGFRLESDLFNLGVDVVLSLEAVRDRLPVVLGLGKGID